MSTENNILLAQFIGWELYNNLLTFDESLFTFSESNVFILDLKFHSDWNWLMEVVEKIERYLYDEQGTEFKIDVFAGASIYIPKTKIHIHFPYNNSSKIEAVYNACIDFVKWYNEIPREKRT